MGKGGHPLLEKNSINFLKKNVLSKSFLITPNRLEAEEILKFKINNVDNLTKIKKAFNNLGVQRILLKGGHISENQNNITDILFDRENIFKFKHKRINTNNTHGTGCSLAAAIAANLSLGKNLREC